MYNNKYFSSFLRALIKANKVIFLEGEVQPELSHMHLISDKGLKIRATNGKRYTFKEIFGTVILCIAEAKTLKRETQTI